MRLGFIAVYLYFNAVYSVFAISYLEAPKDDNVQKNDAAKSPQRDGKSQTQKEDDEKDENPSNVLLNKTLFGAVSAEADSMFKGVESSGIRKFDPGNALTRGGGYWCSAGNLSDDHIVSWTGTLKLNRVLRGLIIRWVYAPAFVSISTSRNLKDEFQLVVPFQASKNVEQVQEIDFGRKVDARRVKIQMKGQTNGYFGIEFVQFIGVSNPVFRIQSGITSIEDMCLQVDETGEVVLDSCIAPIAEFSSGDVWRYNSKRQLYNPVTQLCMTWNEEATKAQVTMEPCEMDKNNSWDLMPNNQLRLRRPGNYCLTQHGTKAGHVNVALNKIASCTFTKKNSLDHVAERALDGSLRSFWCSEQFDVEHGMHVDFIVDLQDVYKIIKVEIVWENPALKYTLFGRATETDKWKLLERVEANTKYTSIHKINFEMQHLKLTLFHAPPENENSVKTHYGIYSLAAYTNGLTTIIGNCQEAKESKDARDKYFLESVNQVNLQAGEPLKKAQEAVGVLIDTLQAKVLHLERLYPKMHACKAQNQSTCSKIEHLKQLYDKVANSLHKLKTQQELPSSSKSASSLLPTDCIEIKNRADNSPSGFYKIHRPCGEAQVRVYCDMYTGSSYLLVDPSEVRVMKLQHFQTACLKHGLEPIQIQHPKQLESLEIMLKTMEVSKNNLYPIAVKVKDKFKSLDLKSDVTEHVKDVIKEPSNNIIAISTSGPKFVDGTSTDFSGIICSSNYSSIRLPRAKIRLGCSSTIEEHAKLKNGISGSEFLVSCPDGCFEWDVQQEQQQVQGGNNGIYSNTSPICLSAIHSGEYNGPGTFKVTLVPSLSEYQGFYQNGIVSASAPGILGQLGFTVEHVQECKPEPVVLPNQTPATAVASKQSPSSKSLVIEPPAGGIRRYVTSIEPGQKLNVATVEAIGTLVGQVGAKSGPIFLDLFRHHVDVVTANVREMVKEADIQRGKTELLFSTLQMKVYKLQEEVQSIAARLSVKKDSLTQAIENMDMQVHRRGAFSNWNIHDIQGYDLYSIFKSDCVACNSKSQQPKWTLSTLQVQSTLQTVISQDAEITTNSILGGSYLTLRDGTFYDFIYSACIFGGTSGTFGLTFRVVDEDNFYILQLRQVTGGYKRLVKVVNGDAFEIARIEDGGFLESVWYTVRIEARHYRISIAIVQGVDPIFDVPEPCIDLIDGTHGSGSIGLYTGQIGFAHFANLHVESLPCIRFDQPIAPPLAPQCNLFQLEYSMGFSSTWKCLQPGPEIFNYRNDIGGEAHVLALVSSSDAIREPLRPTIALLRAVTCSTGTFRISAFPQCDYGWVGFVFHYKDAGHYLIFEASVKGGYRMRQMHGSHVQVLAETSLVSMRINEWNHFSISLQLDSVTVAYSAGAYKLDTFDMEPIFVSTRLQHRVAKHGAVGVAGLDCKACAFTNISLAPSSVPSTPAEIASVAESTSTVTTQTNAALAHPCQELNRTRQCQEMGLDLEQCLGDFCNLCCQHTSRSNASNLACVQSCKVMDSKVVALQRTADEAWSKCSKVLDDATLDCSLCCDSIPPNTALSHQINSLARERCKKLCSL